MENTRTTVANFKRLLELCKSDLQCLNSFLENPQKTLEEWQVDLDPKEAKDGVEIRLCGVTKSSTNHYIDLMDRYYQNDSDAMYEKLSIENYSNKDFFNWSQRQKNWNKFGSTIARNMYKDRKLYYAPIAFELTKGCSGNCPFCCFSPQNLEECFYYNDENAALWNEILIRTKKVIGSVAGTGACYCATEPFDNPDYEKFLKHFYEIFGIYPQTTTVKSLDNVNRTKNLLQMYGEDAVPSVRFSVVSKMQLKRIHQLFTPEELIRNDMSLNNPESSGSYTLAGRAVDLKEKLPSKNFISNFSSSCLIGFIVNMVQHSISLVSPRNTELGMRIYEVAYFTNANSYENALYMLIDKWMKSEIPLDKKLCSNDIKYEHNEDYLIIRGDKIHRKVSISKNEYHCLSLILDGKTLEEVFKTSNFTEYEQKCILNFIQFLYDSGYIDID